MAAGAAWVGAPKHSHSTPPPWAAVIIVAGLAKVGWTEKKIAAKRRFFSQKRGIKNGQNARVEDFFAEFWLKDFTQLDFGLFRLLYGCQLPPSWSCLPMVQPVPFSQPTPLSSRPVGPTPGSLRKPLLLRTDRAWSMC